MHDLALQSVIAKEFFLSSTKIDTKIRLLLSMQKDESQKQTKLEGKLVPQVSNKRCHTKKKKNTFSKRFFFLTLEILSKIIVVYYHL